MRCLFPLAAALMLWMNAAAQDPRGLIDFEEMKAKSEEIVAKFAEGRLDQAFRLIRKIWILDMDQLDYLESQSTEQVKVAEEKFGERLGYLLVREEAVDGLLYQLQYVIKHEIHGIRMMFVYYKGKNNLWFLNSFKWDDSLSELFD